MNEDFSKAAQIIAQKMAKRLEEMEGEVQVSDAQYEAQLQKMREERFVREELNDLTPDELIAFNREYSPLATVSRLTQAAIQEADAKWWDAVKAKQDKEYQDWQQANPTAAQSSRDVYQFFKKQADAANTAYQARLKVRERRQLEAERHREDLARLWSGMDETEQAILKRMMDEEGSELDKVRRWKQANRNPIAGIEDRTTLARLATQRVRRQEYIPPTSDVGSVDSPRTLFAMAARDLRKKQAQAK